MLNKDCKFPTIGKEPLQVCELILWGPAPPRLIIFLHHFLVGENISRKNFMSKKKSNSKKREFNVVIEKDEDGFYVGSVPSLRGCHTQAKSLDQLMKRMTEVIQLCLEEEKSTSYSNEFIGVQKIAV